MASPRDAYTSAEAETTQGGSAVSVSCIPSLDESNIDDSDDGVEHIQSVFSLAPDDADDVKSTNPDDGGSSTRPPTTGGASSRSFFSRLTAQRDNVQDVLKVTRTYAPKIDSGNLRIVPQIINKATQNSGNINFNLDLSPTRITLPGTAGSTVCSIAQSPSTPTKTLNGAAGLPRSPVVSIPHPAPIQRPVAIVTNATGQTIHIPLVNTTTSASVLTTLLTDKASLPVVTAPKVNNTRPVTASSTPVPIRPAMTTPIKPSAQTGMAAGSASVPRLVMLKKKGSSDPGQLMYMINSSSGGSTVQFLIPEGTAVPKNVPIFIPNFVVSSTASGTTPVQMSSMTLPTTGIPAIPTSTIHINSGLVTSPIIASKVAGESPTVHINTNNAANLAQKPTATTQNNTITSISRNTVSIFPKPSITTQVNTVCDVSTSKRDTPMLSQNTASLTTATTKSLAQTSASETASSSSSGVSPHEARIQRLKDLVKKQEAAIEKIREKRRKELEDVHEKVTAVYASEGALSEPTRTKGQFLVPLPPKKARLDLPKPKTIKSNQGFLPTSGDGEFVKLVGLENVVSIVQLDSKPQMN
ncbi:mucin-17 [Nematostella vectensis]|nr:mucin-17 [Nematostella vectensis]